jgi:Golgi phosphoprotein 3 (GPP34)
MDQVNDHRSAPLRGELHGDLGQGRRFVAEAHLADTASAEWAPRPSGGRFAKWPLLADDVFRMVHDDLGIPVVHGDLVAMGLGAALIAELVLTKRVAVHAGRLTVLTTESPIDEVANMVLAQVRNEADDVSVHDWIAYLANDAVDRVGRRMERAGHVRLQSRRRLRTLGFGTTTRYVPTRVNDAAWPSARLSGLIMRREAFSLFDITLAGLILAMDLHRRVILAVDFDVERALRPRIASAPPPLRELLSATEAAIGDGVIVG